MVGTTQPGEKKHKKEPDLRGEIAMIQTGREL